MRKFLIAGSIIAAFFLTSITSYAGEWSDDQKAAWATINAQWEASKNKDYDAWGSYLADDFKGWSNQGAVPGNKTSTISWIRFGGEQTTTLKYELSSMGLVVHGDTAIAHYYYVSVTEDKDGKRKTDTGRWSDTLVRDGKGWKFIGWQGGQDDGDD